MSEQKFQYIGISTSPDISSEVQILAIACKNPAEKDFMSFAKVVRRIQETSKIGLNYVSLE